MITDIFEYDQKRKPNQKHILVLAYDKKFKVAAEKHFGENVVGFKENCYFEIKDFKKYYEFFCKILKEIEIVVIDTNDLCLAFSFLQSAGLDESSVKEIQLYVDDSIKNKESFLLCSKNDSFSSSINNKEKIYSRGRFLIDSVCE